MFGLATAPLLAQSEDLLPELTVLSQRRDGAGSVLREWEGREIALAGARTLDEVLTEEPSFSLYRRQSALFGNPTSAGVSLRNTGATAASRTLVLLDGIPQNDPFGGWVYWARYDAGAVDSVRIVPSARAAVWGNQSPAGVVQLDSGDAFGERHVLRAGGGSHGAYEASTHHRFVADDGTAAVGFSAFGFRSEGFFGVAEGQRGSVDRRLELDFRGADLRFAWRPRAGLTVEPMVSWYEEERGNGTPLARNATEALDVALRVTGEEAALAWQALAYWQRRDFESVFSSVNAARTAETPSLDQFDVPGEGLGGALTLRGEPAERWTLTGGVDVRHLRGETNEDATFTGGQFTRRRRAGGEQTTAGAFLTAGYEADERTRVDVSLRGDFWSLDEGVRRERSLVTGALLRDERQPDRSGWEPSAALAVTRELVEGLKAEVSVGTSFRLPTLNELHRPFRVRNDIVEANPGLDPERFYSMEAGLEWEPCDEWKLGVSVFHHTIRDAIANVPVTDPGEIAAIFGTIPPEGSGSQRRNVEEARVTGVQGGVEWRPREDFSLRLDAIWTETEFSDSKGQPLLEGQAFPQAPELRVMLGGEWRAMETLGFFAGVEYGSAQFDDALGQRRIPDYWTTRIGGNWRIAEGVTVFARVENLFDEEIATGLSSDGIRSTGTPRSFWAGVEWEF